MKSLRRSLNNGHSHGHSHSNSQGQNYAAGPSQSLGHGYPQSPSYAGAGPSGAPYGAAGSSSSGSSGIPAGAPGSAGVNVFSNPLSRPADKVAPPQKVIKALASHRSTNPQELSYQKGDFWYVTGERDGWYEALNPITGSRGLVPKRDFEEFIKGGRQASASDRHGGGGGGQASSSSPVTAGYDHQRSRSQGMPTTHPMTTSPTVPSLPTSAPTTPGGKRGAQPLYAIVQYDFHAERPDELEAKAGEPIVVIAQSNHEWFVAKPIGRLGGPGLIPVAFVEIRDPVTGQPLEAFPSNIPQVEEWKKATAEYKAAAIPLGRLDLAPDQRVANSPYEAAALAAAQAQGAPRGYDANRTSYHSGSAASGGGPNAGDPNLATGASGHTRQESRAESHNTARSGYKPEQDALLPPGELIQLGVPSFHNESGNYWFRLHAQFVPDEPSEPAYTLILYRTYEDFYDFQITLLDTFPTEAGRSQSPADEHPPPRILPYMPGPVDEAIDDELTEYRRDELDAYVRALLDLRAQGAAYILRHELIRTFFAAKYGDYCEEMPRADAVAQLEASLGALDMNGGPRRTSVAPPRLDQHSGANPDFAAVATAPFSAGRPEDYSRGLPGHSPSAQHAVPPSASSATASTASGWPSNSSNTGTATNHSQGAYARSPSPPPTARPHVQPSPSPPPTARPPARPTRAGAAFVKIKIYDRATDDLIALRVHPAVTYHELLDKVRARLGPDVNVLQYRVGGGPVGAPAPSHVIRNDRELGEWMGVEDQRLVLYAEQ